MELFKILGSIPDGKITTYAILAEKLGTSPRAVGKMLNSNPFPVLIPCHKVVNSDGTVGGFVMGTEKKIELLENEGIEVRDNKIVNFNKLLFR